MNKIGFIGGGKMATAIIKGIINSNWCDAKNIFVSDKNEDALKTLEKDYAVQTSLDNIDLPSGRSGFGLSCFCDMLL